MRILFVVPYAPTRIRTRPYHLLRTLMAQGHDVTVATLWSSEEERVEIDELPGGADHVLAERLPFGRSLWNCLRSVPGAEPLQARYSWSPRLATRLHQAVQRSHFDVVHVEHLRGVRYGLALADSLGARADRPTLVWDSVDCITALFKRAARESQTRRVRVAARLELPRTERYEGAVAGRFDRVLVTSEVDRGELLQLAGECVPASRPPRVEVLPNGVDLDYFSPSGEPREPMTLVITGKMSYHANATAVARFVEGVMPEVWAELPDTRVWIVGKDPTRELLKLGVPFNGAGSNGRPTGGRDPRVRLTGWVKDLRPFLRKATLAVAPIQYGVGIQNKVLEALACEAPVVASPQAVSALETTSGTELVVASDSRGLAASIVALLKDPARRARMGRAGRTFVERRHDWRGIGRRLTTIYEHARA